MVESSYCVVTVVRSPWRVLRRRALCSGLPFEVLQKAVWRTDERTVGMDVGRHWGSLLLRQLGLLLRAMVAWTRVKMARR